MCLFATSNGLLGLSTGDVQANDFVGLFTGAATPLILRSIKKEANLFRLVGPASVHEHAVGGRMDVSLQT